MRAPAPGIIDLMVELNRDSRHDAGARHPRSRSRGARPADHSAGRRPHRRRHRRVTSLGFVLRMAAREVRASPRRLLLLTASVAVGVAALVAINSFTANLRDSVRRQAQALLGADLSLESRQPLPSRAERLLDSLVAAGRGRGAGHQLLRHGVRAPHRGHPPGAGRRDPRAAIRSTARSAPPRRRRGASSRPARHVVVDPSLLTALRARVGDTLALGEARFVISGTVASAPGNVGVRAAFGPRVFIPAAYLEETRLLGFGARAEYEAYLRLPSSISAQAIADAHRIAAAQRAGAGPHRGRRSRAAQRDAVPAHRLPRARGADRAAARRHRGRQRRGGLHPPADGHRSRCFAVSARPARRVLAVYARRGRRDGAGRQPHRCRGRRRLPAGAARPARRSAAGGRGDRHLLVGDRARRRDGALGRARLRPVPAARGPPGPAARGAPARLRARRPCARSLAVGGAARARGEHRRAGRDPGREPAGRAPSSPPASRSRCWCSGPPSWALVRGTRALAARAAGPTSGARDCPTSTAPPTRPSRSCWRSASARSCSARSSWSSSTSSSSSGSPADPRGPTWCSSTSSPTSSPRSSASCARPVSRPRRPAPIVPMRIASVKGRPVRAILADTAGDRRQLGAGFRREYRSTYRDTLVASERLVSGRWWEPGARAGDRPGSRWRPASREELGVDGGRRDRVGRAGHPAADAGHQPAGGGLGPLRAQFLRGLPAGIAGRGAADAGDADPDRAARPSGARFSGGSPSGCPTSPRSTCRWCRRRSSGWWTAWCSRSASWPRSPWPPARWCWSARWPPAGSSGSARARCSGPSAPPARSSSASCWRSTSRSARWRRRSRRCSRPRRRGRWPDGSSRAASRRSRFRWPRWCSAWWG